MQHLFLLHPMPPTLSVFHFWDNQGHKKNTCQSARDEHTEHTTLAREMPCMTCKNNTERERERGERGKLGYIRMDLKQNPVRSKLYNEHSTSMI